MRILLISEAFRSIGGVQEVVDNLAAEMDGAGHQVAVFSTPSISGGSRTVRFNGECRELEIPSRRPVTLRHLERLWQTRWSAEVKRLTGQIIAWNPHIVSSHCWSWDRFPAVAAACRKAGVPLVHSLYDSWGGGKMGVAALRSLQGAAALTALSASTRRFFEPVFPAARDASVIIGGVDIDAAQAAVPATRRRPYVFCAARLDIRHKAIDTLIEAFATIADEYPNLDLCITGDGPDRDSLKSLADSAGVGGRVQFPGIVSRSELWSLHKGALFFAMPSRMPEGLGLVFLEAMACGVAVIGTRSGGTTEIVEHGHTGLLVGAQSREELAAAIRRFLKDPEERRRMGERARETVRSHYTWQRFAQAYIEVFLSCAGDELETVARD